MTSGYSNTPLAKKLGLKVNFKIHLHNAPDDYINLFDEMPEGVIFTEHTESLSLDFIHAFYTSEKELLETISQLKKGLKMNGIFWVSWPKGSSKIETNLNREIVRSNVLNTGLVDIKVAAINEDWSGLKFMYRLKDRK